MAKTVKKTFTRGQTVEVQRSVGIAWEPAMYERAYPDWKGWHSVRLPEGRGRYSHTISVPTQRVRNPRTP